VDVAVPVKLLDLFSGAGGAGMGYHRAGFAVTGVDIKPQKNYPFTFIQGDALDYLREHGHEFDVIHASPPCQAFTALRTMPNAKAHDDLLTPTRELLIALGKPYVIENVPGAPMSDYLILCGTMFGLGVDGSQLRRHRHFETNPPIYMRPLCNHRDGVVGVYGGGGPDKRRRRPATVLVTGNAGGFSKRDGVQQFSTEERREAMGIDWMTGSELSQAIPPAYTEYLGRQLLGLIQTDAPVLAAVAD
jgi:DNA (cytosine-5)-methyltransferase 1